MCWEDVQGSGRNAQSGLDLIMVLILCHKLKLYFWNKNNYLLEVAVNNTYNNYMRSNPAVA